MRVVGLGGGGGYFILTGVGNLSVTENREHLFYIGGGSEGGKQKYICNNKKHRMQYYRLHVFYHFRLFAYLLF